MFCTVCGSQLQQGQANCPTCATAVPGATPAAAAKTGRVAQHLKPLAAFQFAISALRMIAGVGLIVVAETILPGIIRGEPDANIVITILLVVGWFVAGWAALGFLAGYGLLERLPWARTLTLVLAFINLLAIPFGTAIGVYSIWVLMSAGAEQEYAQLSGAV